MLTGPQNMPVFGDNQLTPDEKRAIINYVQTIKEQADPGGAGIGRIGPVQRGSGHLGRRHRRPAVRNLLDGEQVVSDARHPPRLDRRRGRPGPLYGGPDDDYTPEQLAAMSREDLDRLGAHYDGVEILHVDPGPAPGSALEKRAIRQVGLVFTLAGVFAFLFVVVYVGSGWFLPDWHWEITESGWSALLHAAARPAAWAWPWRWSASAWCCSPRSCCRTRPRCRTSTTARTSTGSPPARRWSAASTTAGWPAAS